MRGDAMKKYQWWKWGPGLLFSGMVLILFLLCLGGRSSKAAEAEFDASSVYEINRILDNEERFSYTINLLEDIKLESNIHLKSMHRVTLRPKGKSVKITSSYGYIKAENKGELILALGKNGEGLTCTATTLGYEKLAQVETGGKITVLDGVRIRGFNTNKHIFEGYRGRIELRNCEILSNTAKGIVLSGGAESYLEMYGTRIHHNNITGIGIYINGGTARLDEIKVWQCTSYESLLECFSEEKDKQGNTISMYRCIFRDNKLSSQDQINNTRIKQAAIYISAGKALLIECEVINNETLRTPVLLWAQEDPVEVRGIRVEGNRTVGKTLKELMMHGCGLFLYYEPKLSGKIIVRDNYPIGHPELAKNLVYNAFPVYEELDPESDIHVFQWVWTGSGFVESSWIKLSNGFIRNSPTDPKNLRYLSCFKIDNKGDFIVGYSDNSDNPSLIATTKAKVNFKWADCPVPEDAVLPSSMDYPLRGYLPLPTPQSTKMRFSGWYNSSDMNSPFWMSFKEEQTVYGKWVPKPDENNTFRLNINYEWPDELSSLADSNSTRVKVRVWDTADAGRENYEEAQSSRFLGWTNAMDLPKTDTEGNPISYQIGFLKSDLFIVGDIENPVFTCPSDQDEMNIVMKIKGYNMIEIHTRLLDEMRSPVPRVRIVLCDELMRQVDVPGVTTKEDGRAFLPMLKESSRFTDYAMAEDLLPYGPYYLKVDYYHNRCIPLEEYTYFVSNPHSYVQTIDIDFEPTNAPMPLKDLRARSIAYGKVKLTWQPSHYAKGYLIYRKTEKEGMKYLYMLEGKDKKGFIDTHADPDRYNFYFVYPYNDDFGKRNIGICEQYAYAKPGIPDAPTNLRAELKGNQLHLTWKASAGAEGYFIYHTTGNGSMNYLGTVKGTVFRHSGFKRLIPNVYTVYAYKKNAKGKPVMGPVSKALAYTPITEKVPWIKAAQMDGGSRVKVRWGSVSGATHYAIYRKIGNKTEYKYIVPKNRLEWTDTSPVRGKANFYFAYPSIYKDGKHHILTSGPYAYSIPKK